MIAKNDEQKRNVLWRFTISISSVLIIAISAFFFVKLFTDNPMEGKWSSEDSDLMITVKNNGKAMIQWPDEFDGTNVTVEMSYSMEKESKIFILHREENSIQEVVKEANGEVTTASIESAISSLEGSYDYNIENNQLTLTEREYGEQRVFDKK